MAVSKTRLKIKSQTFEKFLFPCLPFPPTNLISAGLEEVLSRRADAETRLVANSFKCGRLVIVGTPTAKGGKDAFDFVGFALSVEFNHGQESSQHESSPTDGRSRDHSSLGNCLPSPGFVCVSRLACVMRHKSLTKVFIPFA